MNTKRHNAITNVLVVLALAAVAAGGWFFIKDRTSNITDPQRCTVTVMFDYQPFTTIGDAKQNVDAIIVARAGELTFSGRGDDDLNHTTVDTHVQEVLWTKDNLSDTPVAGSSITVDQYSTSVCGDALTHSRMTADQDYVLFLFAPAEGADAWHMPLGGQGTFLINDDSRISSPQHVYPEVFGTDFSTTASLTDFVSAIKGAK